MKAVIAFIFILISPSLLLCQNFSNDRLLAVRSNDSINNKARITGSLGTNIKLNGYFDVFGGLQNSETFNVGNINVFSNDDSSSFKMDLYQTQIKLDGLFVQKNGKDIKAVVEFDFWGGDGHMRLRKAYVETGHWQIGQNWNNFGDENIWPNIMEWEGPPSGIWVRSPHIKYFNNFKNEKWSYSMSIEAPIVNYIRFEDVEPLVEEAFQVTPDVTFAVTKKTNGGHFRFSSILRNIRFKLEGELDNFIGYGFSFSGLYATERKNNFQFQLVGGKGITAYMTSIAGLGYDGYPNINNQFEATLSLGGWLSYEYYFTPKLHSNIVFGYTYYSFTDMERLLIIDDDTPELIVEGELLNSHYYGILNMMYEPFERVTIGLELDYGVKNLNWNGSVNDIDVDNSQGRNAMRISFGFMFFI